MVSAAGAVGAEIEPGWEIVARKGRHPLLSLLVAALQVAFVVPPANRARVTFTVRNRATGEVRKVTADSLEEAAILTAQGAFDRAP